MSYRREPSDTGVIVRQPTRHDRAADPVLRHVAADATLTAPQPRPHASGPSTAVRDDASFAAPFRHTRTIELAAKASGPDSPIPAGGNQSDVILVKSGFKQVATRVREIVFVEAARNYVRIHLETGQVLKSRIPIDRLGAHLGRDRFLRVHRGCLVNVDRIRTVTTLLGGRLLLALSDGSKVTVARDRRRVVLAQIGAGAATRGRQSRARPIAVRR